MNSKDANCWICDRPVSQPDELEVFPTSKIAFHQGCLSPGSEHRDTARQTDPAPEGFAAA